MKDKPNKRTALTVSVTAVLLTAAMALSAFVLTDNSFSDKTRIQHRIERAAKDQRISKALKLNEKHKDNITAYEDNLDMIRSLCPHKKIRSEEKPPGCTSEGYIRHVCTLCGNIDEEITEPKGHDLVNESLTEPTCEKEGKRTDRCRICAEKIKEKLPPATHSYKLTESTAPTCDSKGSKSYICTVCNGTKTEKIKATGHSYTDATCTEPERCSVCGMIRGSAKGHIWIEATATAPKTCSVCNITEGDRASELILRVKSSLPHTVTERDWDMTVLQTSEITEIGYTTLDSYDGMLKLTLSFTVTKTFDKAGAQELRPVDIPYEIYTAEGRVVYSDSARVEDMCMGEQRSGITCIVPQSLAIGEYYLILSDEI